MKTHDNIRPSSVPEEAAAYERFLQYFAGDQHPAFEELRDHNSGVSMVIASMTEPRIGNVMGLLAAAQPNRVQSIGHEQAEPLSSFT